MARPFSWLPRLHEIRSSVRGSARSHYSRRELQSLFQVQARAAHDLCKLLPITRVGTAHLVTREDLLAFLKTVYEADDPAQTIGELKHTTKPRAKRQLKTLTLSDHTASLDSLPANVHLTRGELRVDFKTVEELASAMMFLGIVLTDSLDDFAAQYEPEPEMSDWEREEREREKQEAEFFRNFGK